MRVNKHRKKYLFSLRIISFCIQLFAISLNAGAADNKSNFKTEEVEFYNGKIKLSATIFLPAQKGLHPAIAITHGSSKDSKSHPGFISLATLLVNEGYVVLIYDKRGVGISTGEYIETPDMAAPAGDLIAAIKYLEIRVEVDKNKLGVYGHSQGGWVAPFAAVGCRDFSFVVLACGGGVSIREQVLYNMRAELKTKGYGIGTTDSIIKFGRQLYT